MQSTHTTRAIPLNTNVCCLSMVSTWHLPQLAAEWHLSLHPPPMDTTNTFYSRNSLPSSYLPVSLNH